MEEDRCEGKPLDLRCPTCREGAALEAWMAYQMESDREAAGRSLVLQGLPEWRTPLEILWRRN